ncbi:alpha/beta hydrolase family protein [Filimonas lacunae]|nr:prolyl oligopeptidase family serine peptidase [Filimonas lacunae]BAV07685.1 acylamino-acid-releasing enzyme [Filimonas lacunae]
MLLAPALLACLLSLAQKPVLDSAVWEKWPDLNYVNINDNGSFISYTVSEPMLQKTTWVLQSTEANWKRVFETEKPIGSGFAGNNKLVFFNSSRESIGVMDLDSKNITYIPGAVSFADITLTKNGTLLLLNKQQHLLQVKDLVSGKEFSKGHVETYQLSEDGKNILVKYDSLMSEVALFPLALIRLADAHTWPISSGDYSSAILGRFIWNATEQKLAFIARATNGMYTVVYADLLSNKLTYLKAGASVIPDGYVVDELRQWNASGSGLLVTLQKKEGKSSEKKGVAVDIWSFADAKLQSRLQSEPTAKERYAAIWWMDSNKVMQLENANTRLWEVKGDYALMIYSERGVDVSEIYWNPYRLKDIYVINLNTGNQTVIQRKTESRFKLSAGGKYVISYDAAVGHFFCYTTHTGGRVNVTTAIKTNWNQYGDEEPGSKMRTLDAVAWLDNDSGVLLYDQCDIWQVDPAGKKAPVNVTNYYGKKHNMCFRFMTKQEDGVVLRADTSLILCAFNRNNKENGFFRKKLSELGDPALLTMQPKMFCVIDNPTFIVTYPMRAARADAFVVTRQSATEYPNLYFTRDFITFRQLTTLEPEKAFNWMTAELLTVKGVDGANGQAVMYKPENFDSSKKYPVIFFYYEKKSNELHLYHRVDKCTGDINIPIFVSNGYVVVTPDIHYKIGEVSKSAVDWVTSCAKMVSGYSWIDKTRMGITGHSFGGYETNCLVTHSNMFRAACAAAGMCDLMMEYGGLWFNGSSKQEYYDLRRGGLGKPFWEDKQAFIQNSPIYEVKNVATPMLLVHNKNDKAVPFAQSVSFFTALRRLGKPVWMLQYDGEGHSILGKPAMDFTIRLFQFFDHYLKEKPAPLWMTMK